MDEEIKIIEEDLSLKEFEITNKVKSLMVKINIYTILAWVFVLIGFIIVGFSINYYLKNDKFELNELGDFLSGSVASTWSLAGLLFVYVAFLGQKQQLLQQQLEILYNQFELKQNRLELKSQRLEMTLQNDTLKVQKFENTFFQMLSLFHSIVNSMDINEYGDKHHTGREFFNYLKNDLNRSFRVYLNENRDPYTQKRLNESDLDEKNIIYIYGKIYSQYRNYLSHYFRTYYHIIKLIDNTEDIDKNRYISIARAQLSSSEQILLFYNCLHTNGREKFKPLIEEYTLFNNIDYSLLVNDQIKNSYTKKAYDKEM
ncbi:MULTISPECIES: putative phage abortive infection protein [unclassified Empedobacter]|uniref:putative phage abortive infection protein n=1 Tax=Empedobacter TaxID=59734 RepID=UPI00244BA9C8|nr:MULTISPECIES: putative phage abortive infection protein [unclassified Empedobacter]MDH1602313.1 putative phage abortive infection protein [Empedobacter sp. GD03739]